MRDSAAFERRTALKLLRSVALAFSMFSRVPVPRVEWKPENMRYALASLPLVGCLIGLVLWFWTWFSGALSFGKPLFAAGMTLLPVLISGGIHMDGFCDTADALASCAAPERKREILKDPHTGAFAVIAVICYFLAGFALFTELAITPRAIFAVCLLPVMSRAAGALTSICADLDGTGLLHALRGAARHKVAAVALSVWLLTAAAAAVALFPAAGAVMTAAVALCAFLVFRMGKKQFGGMSGDLAGFLIQIVELAMLAGMVLVQKAVAL
jgi:adenosylcobinamide-GDP ribazoletransferase